MRISQELGNLGSELKARHRRLMNINRPDLAQRANRVLAATYAVSCAALVIGLHQLVGAAHRAVVIDKKAIRILAARASGSGLLDKIIYNIEQFNDLSEIAMERRAAAQMNRFATELHHALDEANRRLHALGKSAAG